MSNGMTAAYRRNLEINPKGSPRLTIIYKDPFTTKAPKEKPMNRLEDLQDVSVDHFRPENQHFLKNN